MVSVNALPVQLGNWMYSLAKYNRLLASGR
jgi:hypothetical protein